MEKIGQQNSRKSPRVQARPGTDAKLHDFKQGPLVDISMLGLAFRYIDFGNRDQKCPEHLLKLSITHMDVFRLDNLPCKIVNGHCSLPKKHLSSGNMFRCCVQFIDLTSEQTELVEYFIDNFTENSNG